MPLFLFIFHQIHIDVFSVFQVPVDCRRSLQPLRPTKLRFDLHSQKSPQVSFRVSARHRLAVCSAPSGTSRICTNWSCRSRPAGFVFCRPSNCPPNSVPCPSGIGKEPTGSGALYKTTVYGNSCCSKGNSRNSSNSHSKGTCFRFTLNLFEIVSSYLTTKERSC